MPGPRFLHLEDNGADAELLRRKIVAEWQDCSVHLVDTRKDFTQALNDPYTLILADYNLPGFGGDEALKIAREMAPATPFIFVSGTVGEDVAVESLKKGATDYVLKDRLNRLVPVMRRAIKEREEHKRLLEAESARQTIERRFRMAVDNFPGVFVIFDAERRYCFVNPRVTELTGLQPEEFYGKKGEEIFPPSVTKHYLPTLERARKTCQAQHLECSLELKPGYLTHFVTYVPVLGLDGKLEYILGIATDITERRILEEQLRQAQKVDAIGHLAGGVAHDFNNLLTIINGYSSLLSNRLQPNDPMRSSLDSIRKAGDRAAALTRQLLAFSRKSMTDPKLISLSDIVLEFQKLLVRILPKSITLKTEFGVGLKRVMVDPTQMDQIILNLVINARDAMPNGGTLLLRTENVRVEAGTDATGVNIAPGEYVALVASDTGCGMDRSTQARIFEPFFTTKKAGQGTGLGLSTVQRIARMFNGHVLLQSEPGKGSTFRVCFPAALMMDAADAGRSGTRIVIRGNETVLLVEDDETIRGLVGEFLDSAGYQVLSARHGVEALCKSEDFKGPIHVLLTDIHMPQMNGIDLTNHLTPTRPELKVLLMSADETTTVQPESHSKKIGYIQKPFTPEALTHRIRKLLEVTA